MIMKFKESLSDPTSSCYIASWLWGFVHVLAPYSTASSDIGLSLASVSLFLGILVLGILALAILALNVSLVLSDVLLTSSGIGLACSVCGWPIDILGDSLPKDSLNHWWDVASLIYSLSPDTTLRGDVSGTLLVGGISTDLAPALYVLALSCHVVVPFGVVNDLGLDWQILHSFPSPLDWFIFDDSLLDFLWNVFDLSLNGIVVCDSPLNRDSFSPRDFLILYDLSFERDPFDPFDLIVFNVFLLEWNVLNSWFHWYLISHHLLSQALTKTWISSSGSCVCLVD